MFYYYYCQIVLTFFFPYRISQGTSKTQWYLAGKVAHKGSATWAETWVLSSGGCLSNCWHMQYRKQLSLILSSNIAPLTESKKYTIILLIFLFSIHKYSLLIYCCSQLYVWSFSKCSTISLSTSSFGLYSREKNFGMRRFFQLFKCSGWVGTISQQLPPSFSIFALTSDRSQVLDKMQNPQYFWSPDSQLSHSAVTGFKWLQETHTLQPVTVKYKAPGLCIDWSNV